MKCSLIISVLDSHEIFKRQMRRFKKLLPPDDFEVIILDDGSHPPLAYDEEVPFPFHLIPTHDERPWTPNQARNLGATFAQGDYLLMTDIDHILTPKAIRAALDFEGDMLQFARRVGHLDEHGELYDLGKVLPPHVNTFSIRRELFAQTGGYGEYQGYGSDRTFRRRYQQLVEQNLARPSELGPTICVITEQKWFHKLKRVRPKNGG